MKILNVIESSFRTLVEEQDDTILWLIQALRKAGAEVSILLTGNAVYYAYINSVAPSLRVGGWLQRSPANIPRGIRTLVDSGVSIYICTDDITQRALDSRQVTPGITLISGKDISGVYDEADTVWQW